MKTPRLLNCGCGGRHHPDWRNLDLVSRDPDVLAHDLRRSIPFADASFDGVYSSHFLEHLPRRLAPRFLAECRRVLVPGGVLRLVVPDLEQLARQYLAALDGALAGDREAETRYEWTVIELLDQLVRDRSGGEVVAYWSRDPMPAADYVQARVGAELDNFRRAWPGGDRTHPAAVEPWEPVTPEQALAFQEAGELHRWMYDRLSLSRLLLEAGFVAPRVCPAHESAIPGFARSHLDTEDDGRVRKPDSLYLEAEKPRSA